MKCPRCEGLMTEAHFYDFEKTDGFFWMKGRQCVNCAYAVDPVTEANRRLVQLLVAADQPVSSRISLADSANSVEEAA